MENSIAKNAKYLVAGWHIAKNNISPDEVSSTSTKKYWWICPYGHEWQSSPSYYYKKKSIDCLYCKRRRPSHEFNFASVYPEVAKEWHAEKNGALLPSMFLPKSNKIVWWKCENGHEWTTAILTRANGSQCSTCTTQDSLKISNMGLLFPQLVSEWDDGKNHPLTPFTVTKSNPSKIWWICHKGHQWQASIISRTKGSGCKICAIKTILPGQSFADRSPHLIEEWCPRNHLLPNEVTYASNKKVFWICKRGHRWEAIIQNRANGYSQCIQCKKNPPD